MLDIVINYLSKFVRYTSSSYDQNRENENLIETKDTTSNRDSSSSKNKSLFEKILSYSSTLLLNNNIDIEKQESLYIPLSGSFSRDGKDLFDLFDEITKNWLKNNDIKLLTLLADGGSGKSTFI